MERWLGEELAEGIARNAKGWYGPPIAIAGVPGHVYVAGSGDYVGAIKGGYYACLADYIHDRYKRIIRQLTRRQLYQLNTGFADLPDLISEAMVGGKMQSLVYNKSGIIGPAITACLHLWAQGTVPAAGSNAGAAAGGTVPTNTTTGGFQQINPNGSDTLHLATWTGASSIHYGALMLYDYIFGVNNSLNATNTAITGVPTRYEAADAVGNFCSARVTTVMTATSTDFTLTYVDQAGNTAEAAAALTGRVSSAVGQIPFTQPLWFIPLNAPDSGLRSMTNIQSSGANTGEADWVIGHPLAILPTYAVDSISVLDGINSAFSLVEIKPSACLALMEFFKNATGANIYRGVIQMVSG